MRGKTPTDQPDSSSFHATRLHSQTAHSLNMVIGEATNNGEAVPPPQQFAPQKATIENIMSGIENTGTVKMNNHRKKLRQR